MHHNKTFKTFYEASSKRKPHITAGILMYHIAEYGKIMVFLTHPGGPYFYNIYNKFGIPKGHVENGESIELAAIREFQEETGIKIDDTRKIEFLTRISLWYDKELYAYVMEGTGKEEFIKSNEFDMEWPKNSGKVKSYPEIREGQYFELNDKLKNKMSNAQKMLLDHLVEYLEK